MQQPMDMSREEMEKALEKAKRELQETLNKMSPEERAQAEAKAKKMMEDDRKELQNILDQAAAVLGTDNSNHTQASKFCPHCGAPAGSGNFCTYCGSALK